jgi:RNA polymerase sigma-70 factor (ECF subfamily)
VEGLAELAFRRHHAQVYRYLRHKTGDPDLAEDLAQDVFLQATVALSRDGFCPSSMPAWLHTIAKRRFADDARRRRVRLPLEGSLSDGSFDELPLPGVDGDERRAIIDAIDHLPAAHREVIAMRLLAGLSFRDIACSLGIGEAAAKMRFHRALALLRRELEELGVGE